METYMEAVMTPAKSTIRYAKARVARKAKHWSSTRTNGVSTRIHHSRGLMASAIARTK